MLGSHAFQPVNMAVLGGEWQPPWLGKFQGKRNLLKNPEYKSMFNTAKNFRASASCSEILNGKNVSIQ